MQETANILNGIARNDSSEDKWDGVRDFHISRFELGYTCQSMVDSFNYNTNQWSGRCAIPLVAIDLLIAACRYVFRRLRFLGNRVLSHGVTLLFLAVWHGYHLGYFLLFAFEFACVIAEKQVCFCEDGGETG